MDMSSAIPPFAREAQRIAFSRTSAATKMGRAVTSKPPEVLARVITIRVSQLGGSRKWKKSASTTLADWVLHESSHAETTLALREVIKNSSARPEKLLVLSKILCSVGLFEVGLVVESRAKEILERELMRSSSSRALMKRLQLAIHEPNVAEAQKIFEKLAPNLSTPEALPSSSEQIFKYLSAWLGTEHRTAATRATTPWEDYLSGARVVIYGPGNVTRGTAEVEKSEIVARVAGPGAFSWDNKVDLAGGRTNIVYLIPETLSSIGESEEHRAQIFDQYKFVCIKRGEAAYIPHSRRVEGASLLFISGHPNMVPLAVTDILSVPGSTVRVIGSDFFASASSYRPDSIRTTPEGRPQTNQGSSGNQYDRSTLMASHNAFQNRRLVKNLLDSGRVTGDDAFLEACSLSDLDYARRLDLHYGQHRL